MIWGLCAFGFVAVAVDAVNAVPRNMRHGLSLRDALRLHFQHQLLGLFLFVFAVVSVLSASVAAIHFDLLPPWDPLFFHAVLYAAQALPLGMGLFAVAHLFFCTFNALPVAISSLSIYLAFNFVLSLCVPSPRRALSSRLTPPPAPPQPRRDQVRAVGARGRRVLARRGRAVAAGCRLSVHCGGSRGHGQARRLPLLHLPAPHRRSPPHGRRGRHGRGAAIAVRRTRAYCAAPGRRAPRPLTRSAQWTGPHVEELMRSQVEGSWADVRGAAVLQRLQALWSG